MASDEEVREGVMQMTGETFWKSGKELSEIVIDKGRVEDKRWILLAPFSGFFTSTLQGIFPETLLWKLDGWTSQGEQHAFLQGISKSSLVKF